MILADLIGIQEKLKDGGIRVVDIHNFQLSTDFEMKPDMTGICIDKDALVTPSSGLYNGFVAYCRHQLDRLLFSCGVGF